MIPKECRRLAEIDFPLGEVNDACDRENNIRTRIGSGHLSLLHTWWARRPLASCRALLLSLLLPDPTDSRCPAPFKAVARKVLQPFHRVGSSDSDLLRGLLKFLAEVAQWDLVNKGSYLSTARKLVRAAHGESPHVFDPFAGGGSIPLEALRLGCEATASELNPVAWLQLKIALEWCPRYGQRLADLFEHWSGWVLQEVERQLAEYYPPDAEKRKPLAYLWARTIKCEAARCGATVPLVRNLWLSTANCRKKALRIVYPKGSLAPRIEVFEPAVDSEVAHGTAKGFRATCPKCQTTTERVRVQAQLRERRGGAEDALLLAVARQNASGRGKDYFTPTEADWTAYEVTVQGYHRRALWG